MNFVIFMPDELRAESVGCYGHPLIETPNIDRLAAEGTRFDQCHVQHTVCSPSRCSMLTGWYPHTSGHRTLWHLLRPHEPNLFRYLKEAGYTVHAYGKNDALSQESLPLSLDAWGGGTGAKGGHGPNPYAPDDPEFYSFLYDPFPHAAEDNADARKVLAGIEFLDSRPREPFCLYLPLSFPHCPYSAPQPWHDRYRPDDVPELRPVVDGKPDFHELIRSTRRLDQCDEGLFRKINAVYLGMTSFIDAMLGWVLDALERNGQADDTAVFFLSDHGDWAGDWGLVEKWPSGLDDCLTRVPFIARVPGGAAGHTVGEVTELFDLMPTLLELADVPVRHTHFARSLVPQLGGAVGDPGRAAFADGGYDPHEPHCFEGNPQRDNFARNREHIYWPKAQLQQEVPGSVCRSAMIRTGRYKLVRRTHGHDELYDLATDPRELNNRVGDASVATVQRDLETRLTNQLLYSSDVVPFTEDARGWR